MRVSPGLDDVLRKEIAGNASSPQEPLLSTPAHGLRLHFAPNGTAYIERDATAGPVNLADFAKESLYKRCLERRFYGFGPLSIPQSQLFAFAATCVASVNLKPVVRGHCLVFPRRFVQRVSDLTKDEATELFLLSRDVGAMLEDFYREDGASSLTFVVQDGADAGQSVPCVHMHVLPRRKLDFAENDDIYKELRNEGKPTVGVDFEKGRPRTPEEMAAESSLYRAALRKAKSPLVRQFPEEASDSDESACFSFDRLLEEK